MSLSLQLQVSAGLGRLVLHTESASHLLELWNTGLLPEGYIAMKLMKPPAVSALNGMPISVARSNVSLITFSSNEDFIPGGVGVAAAAGAALSEGAELCF